MCQQKIYKNSKDFLHLTTGPFLASLKRLSNRRISQLLHFSEPKRGEDGTKLNLFAFYHDDEIKIT